MNEYTVGTLVVDMFNATNKNLVFRGTAEDEISDNPGQEQEPPREGLVKDVQELSARAQDEVGLFATIGSLLAVSDAGRRARC